MGVGEIGSDGDPISRSRWRSFPLGVGEIGSDGTSISRSRRKELSAVRGKNKSEQRPFPQKSVPLRTRAEPDPDSIHPPFAPKSASRAQLRLLFSCPAH